MKAIDTLLVKLRWRNGESKTNHKKTSIILEPT